jgi:hypothetical protein
MDYAPIQAFLVGRCGKTIREAAQTSYAEYMLLVEGRNEAEKGDWEKVRWMAYMQWAISPNLKRRPRTPQDVIRFPWEENKAAEAQNYEPLTEAEIERISKIFNIERKHISNG